MAKNDKYGKHFEPRAFPLFVKYMGSKAKIIPFVVSGIEKAYVGNAVCDLFAGACNLSGAIGNQTRVFSNDIQAYSGVLAKAYLTAPNAKDAARDSATLLARANELVNQKAKDLPHGLDSSNARTIDRFVAAEEKGRALIAEPFSFKYHLFLKNYSGTWWSPEQCLWIDSLRQVADELGCETASHHWTLCALMYAMAYCSQGTGHYAQWREPSTESSLRDIQIYRRRSIPDYFSKKFDSIASFALSNKPAKHEITTADFRERLSTLPACTIYADPPYCFVHYSRFYHALETLVRYDYPELQRERGKIVKGRYRVDRHQSPFCIRSQVQGAFTDLFRGTANCASNLVLSYSKTALIPLETVLDVARAELGKRYEITVRNLSHTHMTMGRRFDRDREVTECLLIAERRPLQNNRKSK